MVLSFPCLDKGHRGPLLEPGLDTIASAWWPLTMGSDRAPCANGAPPASGLEEPKRSGALCVGWQPTAGTLEVQSPAAEGKGFQICVYFCTAIHVEGWSTFVPDRLTVLNFRKLCLGRICVSGFSRRPELNFWPVWSCDKLHPHPQIHVFFSFLLSLTGPLDSIWGWNSVHVTSVLFPPWQ